MSVEVLKRSVSAPSVAVLSLDIFDTVLLRDGSTQTERFTKSARRAARELGIEPRVLVALRILTHTNAYRAIRMERPGADPTFAALCRATVAPLGLGETEASVLAACERDVDVEGLTPGGPALAMIDEARRRGQRVIATSDTWYSADDIGELLRRVLGTQPFDSIYTSSEVGASKQDGGMFARVAEREGRPAGDFLHAGDTKGSDFDNATAAGWAAAHMPRGRVHRLALAAGKVKAFALYSRG